MSTSGLIDVGTGEMRFGDTHGGERLRDTESAEILMSYVVTNRIVSTNRVLTAQAGKGLHRLRMYFVISVQTGT